jgi:RHS repeat-associated protein
LDDQFNYVPSGSGYLRVAAYTDELGTLAQSGITIPRNGYLFVYLSNETKGENVFFDNLAVNHYTGPLVEETHYYPFGLTMAGISSKAAGRLENKKLYNGYEANKDLDLNWYESFYRVHDPQIGRFWQIDPKPNDFVSLYAAMDNNPILKYDILGDTVVPGAGFWSNFGNGFSDGWKSTKSFLGSLGTSEGWSKVGNGIISMFTSTSTYDVSSGTKYKAILSEKTAFSPENAGTEKLTLDNVGYGLGYGVEKAAEAVVISKGAGIAVNAVKGTGSVNLYRAVSEVELSDIAANGFKNNLTGYSTGKLFATSAQDAAQYGKSNFSLDGIPNTIIKAKVPKSVMKVANILEADGMKSVFIPGTHLYKVKPLAPLNFSPKPTNPYFLSGW